VLQSWAGIMGQGRFVDKFIGNLLCLMFQTVMSTIDYYDSLLALISTTNRKLEKRPAETEERKAELRTCRQQLEHCIRVLKTITLSDNGSKAAEIESIESTILSAEATLGNIKVADILKHELKSTHISESLYLNNIFGAIPYSRVCHPPPAFHVRGRKYLEDGNKCQSHGSLFCLRGIQLLSPQSFVHNVAKEEWCGYPHFKHDNEWFVLNFLVSCSISLVALFHCEFCSLSF
jgi:hypothetical protein